MKKIYMILAALLMTGMAFASTITIVSNSPEAVYNVEIITSDGHYYNQAEVATGETVQIVAHEGYEWQYAYLSDIDDNRLSTADTTQIVVTTDTTIVAYYNYHPQNPGAVPHGWFDAATGTLTLDAQENDSQEGEYQTGRVSLSTTASAVMKLSGHSKTEVTKIVLTGEAGWLDTWFISNMFPNLDTLDLGTQFTGVGMFSDWTFSNWTVSTIVLPASCTSLTNHVFDGCTNLKTLRLMSTTPPTADTTIFSGVPLDSLVIIVPTAAYSAYLSDNIWNQYNIQPDQLSETKTLTVDVFNQRMIGKGEVVISTEYGVLTRQNIDSQYVYFNLPNEATYTLSVRTFLPETLYEESFFLHNDTTISCANRIRVNTAMVNVCKENFNITDRCLITWNNLHDSTLVYGSGNTSPLMYFNDTVRVHIEPMGELAELFYPKDTIVIIGDLYFQIWLDEREQQSAGRTPAGHLMVYTTAGARSNAIAVVLDSAFNNVLGRYAFTYNEGLQRNEIYVSNMTPGTYHLVALDANDPYADANLADFLYGAVYLGDAIDTVFVIQDSLTTTIALGQIPTYTQVTDTAKGTVLTHISLAHNEILVGQMNTLTFDVDLRESPASLASNELIYYLVVPNEFTLVENSVLIGTSAPADQAEIPFTATQKAVAFLAPAVINKQNIDATRLRCCFTMSKKGDYELGGMLDSYDDEIMVPGAALTVSNITLEAPERITYIEGYDPKVDIHGMAPAFAQLDIHDAEGNTLATTSANGLGRWNTTVTLSDPADVERLTAVTTNQLVTLVSDTAFIATEQILITEAAQPTEFGFTHFNTWCKRPMPVRWQVEGCSLSTPYYYYYLAADFTFSADFKGIPDSVVFVVYGANGVVRRIPATMQAYNYADTTTTWAVVQHVVSQHMPLRMEVEYFVNGYVRLSYAPCKNVEAIADPSGYIYEAVTSNRVEGVTATAYTKANAEAAETLWDAAPYDQVNPQTTDFAGRYAWDVPMGLWQVRFSKPGFEPTQTEWLPVPPPQLEVNIPMVRLSAPTIESFQVFEDSAVIIFDRYMQVEDMTTAKLAVNEVPASTLTGHITLLDKEARTQGDSVYYVSKVAFKADRAFATQQVSLTIAANQVHSYAGVPMAAYSTTAAHEMAVTNMIVVDTIRVVAGQSTNSNVSLLPAGAASGKTLTADNFGSTLCTVSNSQVVNASGSATLNVTGLMPGTTQVKLTLAGTDLEAYVVVVVSPAAEPRPVTPTAIQTIESTKEGKAVKAIENDQIVIRVNGKRYNVLGLEF